MSRPMLRRLAPAALFALALALGSAAELRAESFDAASGGGPSAGAVVQVLDANGKAIAVGQGNPLAVSGKTEIAVASLTRPADTTAYASGDLVANSTTAGSVVPLSLTVARVNDSTGMIRRCRITASSTSVTNASFRVHLYNAAPTPSNGDNGAWLTDKAANYLGACDVTLDKAFTDGAKGIGTPVAGSEINFKPASGTRLVYALIEARGAYTPTSGETFTVALEVLQD